ncbi:hypothetical protein HJG60_008568 [Phyllostomus discolor]|uniref:Uncharacterized protein n=1 Tax=Phyllostomus discolor TaxID=89673 RepID=A0A834DKE8_9CHIR|nr:hypothetical protein HJG60_008568 [Phyllostomus discolor]
MHTDLHPLQNVHLWASESPSSRSGSLLQDLGCAVLSLHVVAQETMCRVTLSQRLQPREAGVPSWDPASRNRLPSSVGSKPLGGPTSPGPMSTSIHAGSRARGPECPKAKSSDGDLAPSSKASYQEPPSQKHLAQHS